MPRRICTSAQSNLLKFLHPFKEAISKIPGQMRTDRTARAMLLAFATMVDSRKGGVMVDRMDLLTERVQVVEVKVDRLSSTVDQLSTRVDGLTTTVGQLSIRVDGLTTRVDGLTTTVGELSIRVDGLTTRVDGLTTTVNELSTAMTAGFVEQREYTEFSHARLEARIAAGYTALEAKMNAGNTRLEAKMDAGFARVDRKLDQLIDAHRPRPKPKRRNE